jgi:enoyl-CoA hydratase
MSNSSLLLYEKGSDGVARIIFNNPPLNLVTREVVLHLDTLLTEIEQDDGVRAVIVTGMGNRAFSAGSDVKEMLGILHTIVEDKLEDENRVFEKLATLSKPTIAAIQGVALGGGCEIALACDLRVMSRSARIGLPEITLGWFPGMEGLYRLPQIVGPARAKELLFLGDLISAEQAFQIGLINRLAEPDQVMAQAEEMAAIIANRARHAIRSIKQAVNESIEQPADKMMPKILEMSRDIFRTEDAAEGIDAFFTKRQPQFKHR